MDEGNGALVRVQAEPAAVWEAAFYLKEGDAITTWVQNMSWCVAGSDSSLSSSHLMPAWWHSGSGSGTGGSGLTWAGSQTLVRASAQPELAHGVCCVLFPHPPTSGTGSVLWWDERVSKVELVCEGVGSVLMSVGSISCLSARQQNAGSSQHVLVGDKRVSPKSQRCCVCTVGCVPVKHTNNLRSCSPWRAFLVIVGMCALKDTQIRVKRELQWELNCFHVGLFSCLQPFGYCLIWNISSFLPFFLSSLLTPWDALFSLIMKKDRLWLHRRSNSIWNSLCRCILQDCSISDSFSIPSIGMFAVFRVSRTIFGCPLNFWLDFSSVLCSVLPHKCVAREQEHHSFSAELSHPLLQRSQVVSILEDR